MESFECIFKVSIFAGQKNGNIYLQKTEIKWELLLNRKENSGMLKRQNCLFFRNRFLVRIRLRIWEGMTHQLKSQFTTDYQCTLCTRANSQRTDQLQRNLTTSFSGYGSYFIHPLMTFITNLFFQDVFCRFRREFYSNRHLSLCEHVILLPEKDLEWRSSERLLDSWSQRNRPGQMWWRWK